jgi:steroid 5-alpha reductase family enzyme
MSLSITEIPLAVFFYMLFWFLVSLVKKRNDLADVAWGLGFLLIALVSFNNSERSLLILSLIFLWSLRLSIHIWLRNRGRKEDYRYQEKREKWGKLFYLQSFFQVYLLQGFLMLVISTPIILVNFYGKNPLVWLDFLGLTFWIIGFFFESVGDWQLIKFLRKSEPGKIMSSGLWKYSRHPNYFGEFLQWFGVALVAFSVPYGFWGLISPLILLILLTKVSGIPLLEKKMAENPEFQEYKKKTSVFLPWFPKRS